MSAQPGGQPEAGGPGQAGGRPFGLLALVLAALLACVVAEADVASALADLSHSRAEVRAGAARLLGYLGDQQNVEDLAQTAMTDRAVAPRAAAATALAQIGERSAGPALLARLLTLATSLSPTARPEGVTESLRTELCALISAVAVLRPEGAVDALRLCLEAGSERIKEEAVRGLALLGGTQAARLLADANAANELGWIADADPVPLLTHMLRQVPEEPGLADEVVCALARQPGMDALQALTAALSHPLPTVRLRAAEMLARLEARQATDVLERLCQDAVPDVGAVALGALALMDMERGRVQAMSAVQDSSGARRFVAALVLGLAESPAATDALLRCVRSSDSALAPWAIDQLAEADDERVAPALLAAASDGRRGVGPAAVAALAWRGDSGATEYLLRALATSPGWHVAAEGLALSGSEDAVPGLERLAAEPGGLVQERALITLGLIGGEMAGEVLCRQLAVRSSRAARLARVNALARIPGKRAAAALAVALSDRDRQVAARAAYCLGWRGPDGLLALLRFAQAAAPLSHQRAHAEEALRALLESGRLAQLPLNEELRQALAAWVQDSPRAAEPWAQVILALAQGRFVEDAALATRDADPRTCTELCRLVGLAGLKSAAPLVRHWLQELEATSPIAAAAGRAPRKGAASEEMMVTALRTLTALGDQEALPLILNALRGGPAVREAALEALGQIAPESQRPVLQRGCRDGAPGVRETAARALLGDLRGDEVPLIWELVLAREPTANRLTAAQNLRGLPEPVARPLLLRLLVDNRPEVALAAGGSLAVIAGRSQGPATALAVLRRALVWARGPASRADARALAAAYSDMARLYLDAGDAAHALRWYRRAFLTQARPEWLQGIAVCFERLGNVPAAQRLRARTTPL